MADEFAEYIYGTKVRTSEDERVWELTPQSERRERIVRCRDCEHAITSYRDGLPRCAGPLVMEATLVSPDGFCAWGERKGE